MPAPVYDPQAPKRAANLSINRDLLRQAREQGINLSKALEERLCEMLLELKRQRWREENRAAIESYNRRVEEEGVFSDEMRSF